jgi:hypothetical protein
VTGEWKGSGGGKGVQVEVYLPVLQRIFIIIFFRVKIFRLALFSFSAHLIYIYIFITTHSFFLSTR